MTKKINRLMSALLAGLVFTGTAAPSFAYALHDDQAVTAMAAATAALQDGTYTADVYGWHSVNDKASMMASALSKEAVIEVENGQISATIAFQDTVIMGLAVSADNISRAWPEPAAGQSANEGGITGTYDSELKTNTYTFALTTLDMPALMLYVDAMSGPQTIRLKFENVQEQSVENPDNTFGSAGTVLAAGVYQVPIALKNASSIANPSMAASCLAPTAQLTVDEDGTAMVDVAINSVTVGPVTAYAQDFKGAKGNFRCCVLSWRRA